MVPPDHGYTQAHIYRLHHRVPLAALTQTHKWCGFSLIMMSGPDSTFLPSFLTTAGYLHFSLDQRIFLYFPGTRNCKFLHAGHLLLAPFDGDIPAGA